MNVHYTARHTEFTSALKDYCAKRLAGLDRLMGFVAEVDVILSAEKTRQKAEIHVKAKGAGLVVCEDSHDMLVSLNRAFDSLEKKLKKEREKYREKKRRGGRERKAFPVPAEPGEAAGDADRVVQAAYYSMKPMTLEEALIQFDLKKKEVFVFRNVETDGWAVIFRRKDGARGLVEPE